MAIERVVLANPRGFCAGVVRAIDVVEQVLDLLAPPIYVFHEIVHNVHVVQRLRKRGAVFVESVQDVPQGAVCIFSAHGISPEIRLQAKERRLRVIDATCPLVTKVHLEVIRYAKAGYSLILIGHAGHEEVEGTMGEAPMHLISSVADVDLLEVESPDKLIYLTQTTLSLDDSARIVAALRRKYPSIQSPRKDDICYATQNRQNAVKELASRVDVILVTGSQNSSNSQRLCEVASSAGVPAYLINDETEIDSAWFEGARVVGVTAGASAPEECVGRILSHLETLGAIEVEDLYSVAETVRFSMPREVLNIVESLVKVRKGSEELVVTTSYQEASERALLPKELVAGAQAAIEATQAYLLHHQREDGHWCAELEGDTILESEYILTLYFIGRGQEDRAQKAANYLRRKALTKGGWAIYPGGPANVSASVKAYFVLKLLGDDPSAPHMAKARKVIRELGGLDAANSFTRLYLALFGQYPWEKCPAVPPEIILLPAWSPVNLYDMSSWSRGIVVPLAVIWAHKPSCPVPEHANIGELLVENTTPLARPTAPWPTVFAAIDTTLKVVEGSRLTPLRKRALRECERWMVKHFEQSDGIGAIFPPIINAIIALRCLGYDNEHPLIRSQIHELEKLEIEEEDTLRVQPCRSPVWDTAYAMHALVESGMENNHPALLKACDWILSKEARVAGDWQVKNPATNPGGWYFEYANELYPDLDDTFEVLTILKLLRYGDEAAEERKNAAIQRGFEWALSMQNLDGGWGAFDRGCDKEFLTQIPFADHNAMIDPSTSDITARGIETLVTLGYSRDHPVVRRALEFLHKEQEHDGTWFGRWGVNYVYGTWLALRALRAAGEDMTQTAVQRAAKWLRAVQNTDGGWGESPRSYDDPAHKGKGPSTAAQTAWALMALMAAGDFESLSVQRGIAYLLQTQKTDGSWYDEHWTGTGFPRVFYLHYHYYAVYFPLMALGMYGKNRTGS